MSAELNENYKATDGTGYLNSTSYYYGSGMLSDSGKINQRKENTTGNFGISTRLSYTEPLSRLTFLTFRYGLTLANSRISKAVFQPGRGGLGDATRFPL